MLIPDESPYWLDVDDVHLAIKFAREDLRRRRRRRQRWSLSLCVIAVLIGLGHLVAYLTGDAPAINGFSFLSLLVMFVSAAVLVLEPYSVLFEDVQDRPWDEQEAA